MCVCFGGRGFHDYPQLFCLLEERMFSLLRASSASRALTARGIVRNALPAMRTLSAAAGGHGGHDAHHEEEEFYVDHDDVYHIVDPQVELWKKNLPEPVPFPVYPVSAGAVEFLLPMPYPQHVFEEPLVHVVAYPKNWQSLKPEELQELIYGPAEPEDH
jgi:hypothetical protein